MRFLPKALGKVLSYRLHLMVVAVLAVAFLWAVAVAQDSESAEKAGVVAADEQKIELAAPQEQKKQLQIGTCQPRRAFNMYYGTQNLRKQIQKLQSEEEMSQEQLQQTMQEEQQQLIQQFQRDLKQVMPQLAQDANVPVIAIQVVYRKPSVEIKDLTADLIKKMNQLGEKGDEVQGQPILKQPLPQDTKQK
jgi:hypothetical protein